jgi:soluble lytic murein transglycosylase-like protein
MISVIVAAAQSVGIPAALLLAVCYVESGHKNVATHHDGGSASIGICQVKYSTARMMNKDVYISELFEPRTNAESAARYLAHQYRRYNGNWRCAVGAFNSGSVKCVTGFDNAYTKKVWAALRSKPWNGSKTQ